MNQATERSPLREYSIFPVMGLRPHGLVSFICFVPGKDVATSPPASHSDGVSGRNKKAAPRRPVGVKYLSSIIVRCVSGGVLHIPSDVVRCTLRLINLSFRLHLRITGHFADGVFHRSLSLVGGAFNVFLVHAPISI